jgi:hypothetical protein
VKFLLDECLPRRLAKEFIGHEVRTVQQAGWASLSNGKLLSLMENSDDVFITIDSNLATQRNPGQSGITIVILSAKKQPLRGPSASGPGSANTSSDDTEGTRYPRRRRKVTRSFSNVAGLLCSVALWRD